MCSESSFRLNFTSGRMGGQSDGGVSSRTPRSDGADGPSLLSTIGQDGSGTLRVLACLLLALEGILRLGALAVSLILCKRWDFSLGRSDCQELLPFPPSLLLLWIPGNPLHPQLRSGVRVM